MTPVHVRPTDADPTPFAGGPVGEAGLDVGLDAELEALALAVRPGQPPAADAVPIGEYLAQERGTLPEWYMPTPWVRARARSTWARVTVLGLVGTFLVLEALGLCSTYGHVVVP